MQKLQGFRTLIFNIAMLVIGWLVQNFDLNISEEHKLAIGTTIITIGNIVLRFLTRTPVGKQPACKEVHELNRANNTPQKTIPHKSKLN